MFNEVIEISWFSRACCRCLSVPYGWGRQETDCPAGMGLSLLVIEIERLCSMMDGHCWMHPSHPANADDSVLCSWAATMLRLFRVISQPGFF